MKTLITLIILSIFSSNVFAETFETLVDPSKTSLEKTISCEDPAYSYCTLLIKSDGVVLSKIKIENRYFNNAPNAIKNAVKSFESKRLTAKNKGKLLKLVIPDAESSLIGNYKFSEVDLKTSDIKWLTGAVSIDDGNQDSQLKVKLALCQENLTIFATNIIQNNSQQNLNQSMGQVESFISDSGSSEQ